MVYTMLEGVRIEGWGCMVQGGSDDQVMTLDYLNHDDQD
jgi:hypothetical protein